MAMLASLLTATEKRDLRKLIVFLFTDIEPCNSGDRYSYEQHRLGAKAFASALRRFFHRVAGLDVYLRHSDRNGNTMLTSYSSFALNYLLTGLRDHAVDFGGEIGIAPSAVQEIAKECEMFLQEHPEAVDDAGAAELFWLARKDRPETASLAHGRKAYFETARCFGSSEFFLNAETNQLEYYVDWLI